MSSDASRGSAAHPTDPRALDEFVTERSFADAAASTPAGGVFSFDCEAAPEPQLSSGPLLDIEPTAPRQQAAAPRSLSRSEARQARRQKRRASRLGRVAGAAAAARGWMSRVGDAIASGVRGTAHLPRGRALRRTSVRLTPTDGSRLIAAHAGGAALDDREWTGFTVATLLAIAVVGYGSFLTTAWREPAARAAETAARATRNAVPPASPVVAVAATATPDRVIEARTPARAVARKAVHTTIRPAAFTPSARTLTAMWQRRDTRSLEQAFATLRHQTLAFHRCGMRVTETDRAVARCEGVATASGADGSRASRAATWTIDFRRTAGRWAIASVKMR